MIFLHDIMIINVLIAKGMYLEVWNLKYNYFLYFRGHVHIHVATHNALVIGFPKGLTPGLTTGIVQGGDAILVNFPGGGGTEEIKVPWSFPYLS